MTSKNEQYNQLAYYTLGHSDPTFIHQNVVDAFVAQTADEQTKPIRITFALVGLYLMIEKGFTGRQVQLAHMKLAKYRKSWSSFRLPGNRGSVTAANVLDVPPGKERDEMIRQWCASVWGAYRESQQTIRLLAETELGVAA